jgi:hypothetical protein
MILQIENDLQITATHFAAFKVGSDDCSFIFSLCPEKCENRGNAPEVPGVANRLQIKRAASASRILNSVRPGSRHRSAAVPARESVMGEFRRVQKPGAAP